MISALPVFLLGLILHTCIAGASEPSAAAIREDFSGGTLPAGWRVVDGSWAVEDGALTGSGESALITVGEESWQNYEVEVTAAFLQVQDPERWLSIVFRVPQKGAVPWMQYPMRFRATAAAGTEMAVKTESGWSVRRTAKAAADCSLGQRRKLKLVVQGEHATAWLDGVEVWRCAYAVDRAQGAVGLALSGCRASFDDFVVKRLPDSAPGPAAEAWKCRIVGHRGWSAVYPENTLLSSRMAAQAGADGTECDVYAAADGPLVLMHDKTLQRTTNGKGEVTAATLAELKSLDAGSWKDARFAGEPVPSLEEELMARKGGKCRPVIEIKGKGISKAVVDAVKRAGMVQEASIIAFDATAVKEVRALEPGIECAWLSSKEPEGTPEQQADAIAAEARECRAVVVNLNYNMLSRELVASLKARNLGVWCWTVNDPAVARALMAWGVDAITTDRVDVMLDLRKSLSR